MKPTPLSIVKDRFGDKKSLVKAVQGLAGDSAFVDRLNADKGLALVSNKKLLHLHAVLTRVKDEFGSRSALIDAIVKHEGRSSDKDFASGFEKHPTPRLLDMHDSAKKRAAKKKN